MHELAWLLPSDVCLLLRTQWWNICILWKHAYEIFYHFLTSDHWHIRIFIDVLLREWWWHNWKMAKFGKAASLHEFWFIWWSMLRNFWNDESSVWRADGGNDTGLWVVFLVQEQCDCCWGCPAPRMLIEGQSSVCGGWWGGVQWRNLFSKTVESLSVKF